MNNRSLFLTAGGWQAETGARGGALGSEGLFRAADGALALGEQRRAEAFSWLVRALIPPKCLASSCHRMEEGQVFNTRISGDANIRSVTRGRCWLPGEPRLLTLWHRRGSLETPAAAQTPDTPQGRPRGRLCLISIDSWRASAACRQEQRRASRARSSMRTAAH